MLRGNAVELLTFLTKVHAKYNFILSASLADFSADSVVRQVYTGFKVSAGENVGEGPKEILFRHLKG